MVSSSLSCSDYWQPEMIQTEVAFKSVARERASLIIVASKASRDRSPLITVTEAPLNAHVLCLHTAATAPRHSVLDKPPSIWIFRIPAPWGFHLLGTEQFVCFHFFSVTTMSTSARYLMMKAWIDKGDWNSFSWIARLLAHRMTCTFANPCVSPGRGLLLRPFCLCFLDLLTCTPKRA